MRARPSHLQVDPINSVQFSNHKGYPTCRGEVLQGNQLSDLVQGLHANGLLGGYSHMLTGYIGSASFLRARVPTSVLSSSGEVRSSSSSTSPPAELPPHERAGQRFDVFSFVVFPTCQYLLFCGND